MFVRANARLELCQCRNISQVENKPLYMTRCDVFTLNEARPTETAWLTYAVRNGRCMCAQISTAVRNGRCLCDRISTCRAQWPLSVRSNQHCRAQWPLSVRSNQHCRSQWPLSVRSNKHVPCAMAAVCALK